ncbi:MAG: DUF4332 domain-containing protein [Pirellulales bacterium]
MDGSNLANGIAHGELDSLAEQLRPGLNFVIAPPESGVTELRGLLARRLLDPHTKDAAFLRWHNVDFRDGSPEESWLAGIGLARPRSVAPESPWHGRCLSHYTSEPLAVADHWDWSPLIARRDELATAIERRIAEIRRHGQELDQRLSRLPSEETAAADELDKLQQRLKQVESRLFELDLAVEQWPPAVATNRDGQDQPEHDHLLRDEVAHWQSVLDQLECRQQAIEHDLAALSARPSTSEGNLQLQRLGVRTMEQLLDQADREVNRLADPTGAAGCACAETHVRLVSLLRRMRQQVYELCSQTSGLQYAQQRTDLETESQNLGRCRDELRRHLAWLGERSREHQPVASQDSQLQQACHLDPAYCDCAAHSQFKPLLRVLSRDALQAEQAQLQTERRQLLERTNGLRASLDQLHRDRHALQLQQARLAADTALADMQRELLLVKEQLAAELHSRPTDVSARTLSPCGSCHAEPSSGHALGLASDYLLNMTSGQFRAIELLQDRRTGRQSLRVADERGNWHELPALARSQRDLARLAICLGNAESLGANARDLPMLLGDPLHRLDDGQIKAALAALRHFARDSRQVVLFSPTTRGSHEFAAAGASVWNFREPRQATPVRPAAISTLNTRPIKYTWSPAEQTRRHDRPEKAHRPLAFIPEQPERSPRIAGQSPPIETLRFRNQNIVADLRAIGIHTVADLLSADPIEVARRLSHRGITQARVEKWRRRAYRYGNRRNRGQNRRASSTRTSRGSRDRKPTRQSRERQPENRPSSIIARAAEHQPTISAAATDRNGHDSSSADETSTRSDKKELRFYLNLADPVVNAPSIGPKMAERLQAIGIHSVADLLPADPEQVAQQLAARKVDRQTVRLWQQQASLVCQIPELRGHDAQLLAGCGIHSPDQLTTLTPSKLLLTVLPVADSQEGKRILRGSAKPDLAEVTNWIAWARQSRNLKAA